MSHTLPSGVASGFFPTEVVGHLRPSAQIIQWNIAAPNPSGLRHVESGAIKRVAHVSNRGGFTAQKESGIEIDFGDVFVNDGSGFATDTAALTLNFGEINSNVLSRFDGMFNSGSGNTTTNLVGFNFRYWVGNLSAFDIMSVSGNPGLPAGAVSPAFFFRESAEWRTGFKLELTEISGGISGAPLIAVSGVIVMPSSMPDCPNVHSRENDTTVSGAFLDREFTNFVYTRAFFPSLPSGQRYKLGTYGALGQGDFTLKFSYDYTAFGANIIDPTDVKDFSLCVDRGLTPYTAGENISGWWQMNEASPKISQLSGFTVAQGFSSDEVDMTLLQKREGGGNIGRHSGIVSSGTASGFAMDLRSDRQDQVWTSNDPATTDFDGVQSDGDVGFTITGWIAPNDPSGVDPNVGVGLRPPWKHTGLFCRWDSGTTFRGQYTSSYNADINRFLFQITSTDNVRPPMAYNYMNVDSQDNGHGAPGGSGTFGEFGAASGGGGLEKHKWYFITAGYDPDETEVIGGRIFFRVNDGPIEFMPIASMIKSFRDVGGPPFALGNGLTKANLLNGTIGPGAGQYDNWILHRGKVLNNQEILDIYNKGFGIEFPAPVGRDIDFTQSPESQIGGVSANPVPLRRSLRAWYNFSEPSGTTRLADSQRYWDFQEIATAGSSGFPLGIQATSGIIVNNFPTFNNTEASGALQIRKIGGAGFRDGTPGNGRVWNTDCTQFGPFGVMPYTIVAWVKFPVAGATETIVSAWNVTGNDRYFLFRKDSSNNIGFFRANGVSAGPAGGVDTEPAFAADFTIDRWYFCYAQYETTMLPETGKLTVNVIDSVTGTKYTGSLINSFQWNSNFPDSNIPMQIGSLNQNVGSDPSDIDIAALGSWYRKLTESEINLLFNAGAGLNFGASNFTKIDRVYWDSALRRVDDPSTL